MKSKLFNMISTLSLIMATVTLIATIIIGGLAVQQYTGTASEQVTPPQVNLDDLLAKNDTTNINDDVSRAEELEKKQQAEYSAKLTPLFYSTVNSFNEFAAKTGQDTANEKGLETYFARQIGDLDRDEQLQLMESLAKAAEQLNTNANKYKHINWANAFLPAFIEEYKQQYQSAIIQHNEDITQDEHNRHLSLITASAAGAAFMVFIFFVIVLLLAKIEKNTRKTAV